MPGQPRRFMNAPVLRTDYRLMEVSEDLLGTIMKEGCVPDTSMQQPASSAVTRSPCASCHFRFMQRGHQGQ